MVHKYLVRQSAAPLAYKLGRALLMFSPAGTGLDAEIVRDLPFPSTLFGAALDTACLQFARDAAERASQRPGLYCLRMLNAFGGIVGHGQFTTVKSPEPSTAVESQQRIVLTGF